MIQSFTPSTWQSLARRLSFCAWYLLAMLLSFNSNAQSPYILANTSYPSMTVVNMQPPGGYVYAGYEYEVYDGNGTYIPFNPNAWSAYEPATGNSYYTTSATTMSSAAVVINEDAGAAYVFWQKPGDYILQCFTTQYGQVSLAVHVVRCNSGTTRGVYTNMGSFAFCPQTLQLQINTETSCYEDFYNQQLYPGSHGQASPDVVYKFHLSQPSWFEATTCGSAIGAYLHLIGGTNSANLTNVLAWSNGGGTCGNASLKQQLPVGDYFLVLEGSGSTLGALTADVTVRPLLPPSLTISVNQQDVTSGIVDVVPGGSVSLTAGAIALADGTLAPISSYTWTASTRINPNPATGTTVTVSPPQTTIYTVTGTYCSSLTVTAQVMVRVVRSNRNYITIRTPQIGNRLQEGDLFINPVLSATQLQISTTYFDELGRPDQSVLRQGSPSSQDLVTPITYDALGRPATQYLPYTSGADGTYKATAVSDQLSFYAVTGDNIANDVSPFGKTFYEASPLDRILEQGAPGAAWQTGTNHSVKLTQRTNKANEVRQWACDDYTTHVWSAATYYTAGTLLVKETRDEQNGLTTEYMDKEGKTVLKKVSGTRTVCYILPEGASNPYLLVSALPNTLITSVQSATWGTVVSGSTCDDVQFDTNHQSDVTSIVRNLVSGQLSSPANQVSVPIDWQLLGPDPNPGHGKSLLVVANCISTTNPEPDLLTYYAYDDLGNLGLVIPPSGVQEIPSVGSWTTLSAFNAFVNKWCFSYIYDGRHRVIEKKTPGAGTVSIVYNQRDQPVLQQDANQFTDGLWLFTKYDELERPIATGQWYDSRDRATLQTALDAETVFAEQRDNSSTGYSLTTAFPSSNVTVDNLLSITYYDDYTPSRLASRPFFPENGVITDQRNTLVVGQVTGRVERVLGGDAYPGLLLTTALYYDSKYYPIQSQQDLYPSGTERTTKVVDFMGRALSSLVTHSYPTQPTPANNQTSVSNHTMLLEFDYDHMSRMIAVRQQADSQPKILLSRQLYNEIGQLTDKKLHSTDWNTVLKQAWTTYMQSVDYRYNIRGWLSNINDRYVSSSPSSIGSPSNGADPNLDTSYEQPDLFGMELTYNVVQNVSATSTPQYNGNIAEAVWQTNNPAIANNGMRGYAYHYDPVNRISSADYRTFSSNWSTNNHDFSVDGISYDANSNLKSMNRKGRTSAPGPTETWGNLDQLTYSHIGNRLVGVDDASTTASTHDFHDNTGNYATGSDEYSYDNVGNLISDRNKGIQGITYNLLNKPEFLYLTKNGGFQLVSYVYTASGTKLEKHTQEYNAAFALTADHKTDYANGFVYEDNTLRFAPTPEGRVLYTVNPSPGPYNWKYEYHLRDHLGNLRIAFTDEGNNTLQKSAGMEPDNALQEEQNFAHVAETRLRDAAHARSGDYVARLDADSGRRQGPSIRLAVAPGDSVYAEVFGRYDHTSPFATFAKKGTVVTGAVIGSMPGNTVTDQQIATTGRRRMPFIGASIAVVPQLLNLRQAVVPTAYLRYELFSKDSQLVATRTQPMQRTTADEWQRLKTGVRADSAGYVEVTLVNESGTPVYFDDLVLKQVARPIQENNYDPFGLNLVGIESFSGFDSKFQYNGKEKQEDFGLNWTDYGARMYDTQLGRFNQIDRFSEKLFGLNPYQYAANNPTNLIDINGDSISFSLQYGENREITGVTMNVTGKVLNASGRDIDMDEAVSDLSSDMANTFSGSIKVNGKNVSFKSNIQLKAAKSMSEVNKSDHLIVLSAHGDNLKEKGASSRIGGKVMHINADGYPVNGEISGFFGMTSTRTARHEMGHLAGLEHSGFFPNLMVSGGDGGYLFESQLQMIYNQRSNLNIGNNYTFDIFGRKIPNNIVQYRGNQASVEALTGLYSLPTP